MPVKLPNGKSVNKIVNFRGRRYEVITRGSQALIWTKTGAEGVAQRIRNKGSLALIRKAPGGYIVYARKVK